MNDRMRRIPLEGAVNVRDVGGYPNQDGGQTRWGVFLRADNLDRLTLEDQRTLLKYGVQRIVDLRSTAELRDHPDVFAQSTEAIYKHLPMVEDGPSMKHLEALPTHDEVYRYFLEECQPAIKAILETLCAAHEGCTLYHCAGGKDRTGVITALLLGLVFVHEAAIVQDYALTSEYLAPRAAEWRQQVVESGGDADRFDRLMAADPEVMRRTLAYLQDRYGGIPAYVQAIGVADTVIEALRSQFTAAAD